MEFYHITFNNWFYWFGRYDNLWYYMANKPHINSLMQLIKIILGCFLLWFGTSVIDSSNVKYKMLWFTVSIFIGFGLIMGGFLKHSENNETKD